MPLGGGEPHVASLAMDLLGCEVDGETLGLHEHDRVAAVLADGLGAAHRRAQPGQQLVHAERLGDVVVGPGVQGLDLLVGGVPGGEHQDRHPGPAAQASDHLDAVHVGEPQVQDDDVGVARGGQLERGGPVGRGVHLVLARLQVDHEGAYDLRLVVDHKHPGHRGPAFLLYVSRYGGLDGGRCGIPGAGPHAGPCVRAARGPRSARRIMR